MLSAPLITLLPTQLTQCSKAKHGNLQVVVGHLQIGALGVSSQNTAVAISVMYSIHDWLHPSGTESASAIGTSDTAGIRTPSTDP